MLRLFQDQVARVDRLLTVINAQDQQAPLSNALTFEDIIAFTCQGMWHIRDWVLNDPYFEASDRAGLRRDIETNQYLQVCADLANGSKHFSLTRPRTSVSESDLRGITVKSGVFQVHYYLQSSDPSSCFHGMEIRGFLTTCRDEWRQIIDRHHMS